MEMAHPRISPMVPPSEMALHDNCCPIGYRPSLPFRDSRGYVGPRLDGDLLAALGNAHHHAPRGEAVRTRQGLTLLAVHAENLPHPR